MPDCDPIGECLERISSFLSEHFAAGELRLLALSILGPEQLTWAPSEQVSVAEFARWLTPRLWMNRSLDAQFFVLLAERRPKLEIKISHLRDAWIGATKNGDASSSDLAIRETKALAPRKHPAKIGLTLTAIGISMFIGIECTSQTSGFFDGGLVRPELTGLALGLILGGLSNLLIRHTVFSSSRETPVTPDSVEDDCHWTMTLPPNKQAGFVDTPPLTNSRDSMIGYVLGSYRLTERVGIGGESQVFLATHPENKTEIVVKVYLFDWGPEEVLPQLQSLARIRHPNIARPLHFGRADGSAYLVREYVSGDTLKDILKQHGPLPWARLGRIALHICHALAEAHANNVIHGDIKPSNCIVAVAGQEESVKLIDFDITPTKERIRGTLAFMAPERFQGKGDLRVDIYGLGMMLYQLVAGVFPFTSKSIQEFMYNHLNKRVAPPSHLAPYLGITPSVDTLILKALAKFPEERFSSMSEMAAAIQASLETSFEV